MTFNTDELMELAIQIEKNGKEYYALMTAKSENPKVKEVFEYLGKEEQSHLENFIKIQAQMAENQSEEPFEIAAEYNTPEMFEYLNALSDGRVFPNLLSHAEIANEINTDEQAVYHAIGFEKDTVLFFQEILGILGPADQNRALVEELIRQEKIHIARLYTLLGNL
jgi:rubrerythrin